MPPHELIRIPMARPYRITVSAGICDTGVTRDPPQLINFADGALYWSKAHGRNQSWIYDPGVINELSAKGELSPARKDRLARVESIFMEPIPAKPGSRRGKA